MQGVATFVRLGKGARAASECDPFIGRGAPLVGWMRTTPDIGAGCTGHFAARHREMRTSGLYPCLYFPAYAEKTLR